MKKFNLCIILIMCIVLLSSCNHNEEEPPVGVMGLEHIDGYISDESGNMLKGIRVEVYLDDSLKIPYLESEYDWDSLGNMVPVRARHITHTNEEGRYYRGQPAIGPEKKDVYVVAIDTTEVYESQTKKGQIEYTDIILPWNGGIGRTGAGRVDFTLYPKK